MEQAPSPIAIQSVSKEIGQCVYRVEPLGFKSGRAALVRLGRLLAPALASMDSSRAAGADSQTRMQEAVARSIGELITKLDDADLQYFEDLFRAKTWVTLPNGNTPHLSKQPEHFASEYANLTDYFAWLYHCLEVTYGGFFRDAWQKIASSQSKPQTAEKG